MATYFQPIVVLAQMIGVMDGPACEPEYLLFQLPQGGDVFSHN